MSNRFWREKYGSWTPPIWHYFLPYLNGSDEYGRRMAIVHIPGWGFLCRAYHTCKCEDCEDIREQTAQMMQDLDEGKLPT